MRLVQPHHRSLPGQLPRPQTRPQPRPHLAYHRKRSPSRESLQIRRAQRDPAPEPSPLARTPHPRQRQEAPLRSPHRGGHSRHQKMVPILGRKITTPHLRNQWYLLRSRIPVARARHHHDPARRTSHSRHRNSPHRPLAQ